MRTGKRLSDFDSLTQAAMMNHFRSHFGYGLPLDDDWPDKMGEVEGTLLDEFPDILDELEDLSLLVEDLAVKY